MKCFQAATLLAALIHHARRMGSTYSLQFFRTAGFSKSKMVSRQISKITDGDFEKAESLVQSLELQANRFFSGMQMASTCPYNGNEASADLNKISKFTQALHDKMSTCGLHAIPLDMQCDYQQTLLKVQADTEATRSTLQHVQSNCMTLNKIINSAKK